MTQYLVIPSGGDLPTNETTEIVHTYDNGDRLIRIEQPTVEAGSGTITETGGGLALPDVSQEELALARNSLETLPMIEGAPPLPAYVEFAGPIDGTWLEILREHKVKPLRFQPVDSYLVRGTADALREVAKLPIVRRVIPLARNLKFSVPAPEAGGIDVIISILAAVEESEQIVTELDDLPGVTVDRNQSFGRTGPYLRILALITNEGRENLLKYPLVERIDSFETPRLEDEVSSLILAGQYRNNGQPNGSYLNWLEIQGLNGRNVIIGIVDAGVEEDHPAFTGRITALDGGRRTWHGTMVAGHAAGRYLDERDSDNFIYGLGIAPASELLSQDFSDATVTPQRVCRETVHHGSTIQNNSWGTSTRNPMDYGTLEADYDALVRNANPDGEQPQPLTICFSVGNQGAAGITRPKAAKNIIVTGNSENYRPHEGGAESNNIDQVYTGPDPSSYGNCGDKRIRPHVVAPGEWTASASYNSPSVYRVSDLITWGGGSSGASPKTAGACALLTQWWQRNNNGAAPSPALLRALIVNGAVDTFFGGAIPNMRQGWGRLNVANVLRQDVPHTYIDQSVLLRRRGDSLSLPLRVGDLSQPVKITLAWTDPPGPPGSGSSTKSPSPLVNQLALRVNINGTTYKGNNFENGWSVKGASANTPTESSDNLQNVFLQAGTIGDSLTATVSALSLTTNCLTLEPFSPQQDFALVITNAVLDEVTSPTEVAVIVDDDADGDPKSDEPDDFWDNEMKVDGDDDLLNGDWWDEIDEDEGLEENQGDSEENDVWWWLDSLTEAGDGNSAPRTEAEIPRERLIERESIKRALQSAAEQLGELDSILLPQSQVVTEAGAIPELLRFGSGADADVFNSSEHKLSKALAALMAAWHNFGHAGTRRRVAILVVGRGTRITSADVDALRRLAFHGNLYLLSDSHDLLIFLAQRIHLRRGIHFRFAAETDQLAAILNTTLVQAVGWRAVITNNLPIEEEEILRRTYRFYVTTLDHRIRIVIEHGEAKINRIRIKPPDHDPFTVTPATNRRFTTMIEDAGVKRIVLDVPDDIDRPWAGAWDLQIEQPLGGTDAIAVYVWARSRLDLQIGTATMPTVEAGEVEKPATMLLQLHGKEGVELSAAGIQSNKAGPGLATEAPITIKARPPRNKILSEAPQLEKQEYFAPLLNTTFELPQAKTGATILDLRVAITGRDSAGYRFHRKLYHNVIELEPLKNWRHRTKKSRAVFFTPASVQQVCYEDGVIVGLLLAHGPYQRAVRITNPILRQQLDKLSFDGLAEGDLHFGVRGDELLTVVRLLPDAPIAGDEL